MNKHNRNIDLDKLWSYWFFISFFVVALILSPCAVQSSVLQSLDVDYVQGLNKKKCTVQHKLTEKESGLSSLNYHFDISSSTDTSWVVDDPDVLLEVKAFHQYLMTLKRFIRFGRLKVHDVGLVS